MSRGKVFVIIAAVALVGLLIALPFILEDNANQYSWGESYYPESAQPYGGTVLYKMLEHHKKDDLVAIRDTIYHVMDTVEVNGPASYFFCGRTLWLDSMELDWLLDFVGAGNTAFISSKRFNWPLFDTLFYQYQPSYYLNEEQANNWNVWDYLHVTSDTSIYVPFGDGQVQEMKWLYYNEVWDHEWSYFHDTELANQEYALEISSFATNRESDFTNLIEVPFGQGSFYLHTTPEAFTNYFLLDERGFKHARELLSHLEPGTLLWDEDNRTRSYSDPEPRQPRTRDGALSFIQSEPALRAAFYTLLLFVLLYILFGMRRKQRAIPVLESRANTSIEFSEVISQLYLNQRDHRKLGLLKMKLFQAFVLERYGIRATGKKPEDMQAYAKRVAIKSNVSEAQLSAMMDSYRELTVIFNVDNALLVTFHKQLESFYQNCK